MEELNGDLEDLIVIQFHHHQEILEASLTDLDALVITIHCQLKPGILTFEKLGVKVDDSS